MRIELTKTGRYPFPMGVMDIEIRRDEQHAYAACFDGVYVLTLPSKESEDEKPKPTLIGRHESYVSGVGLLREERSLVSTSYDGTMHFRNLDQEISAEREPELREKIHSFWSWRMSVSPDRTKIASVTGQYLAGKDDYSPLPSEEPTVKVFDLSEGRVIHAWNMLPPVQCVAFDRTGQYLTAGNLMGDLAVWDLAKGELVAEWRTPSFTSWGIIKSHCYISGIFAVAFSFDSQSVFAAGMGEMRDPMAGNGKQLWQRFSWKENPPQKIQESASDQTGEGLMEVLAWHPSGDYFAMAGRLRGGNWNLGFFDATSGKLVGQAKTGMRITSIRFNEDGTLIYVGGMQGQPKPKEGVFPDFGYVERYRIQRHEG